MRHREAMGAKMVIMAKEDMVAKEVMEIEEVMEDEDEEEDRLYATTVINQDIYPRIAITLTVMQSIML